MNLRKLWRKTNLIVNKEIVINKQNGGDSIYYRLLISNEENYVAEDVEIYVVEVTNKNISSPFR